MEKLNNIYGNNDELSETFDNIYSDDYENVEEELEDPNDGKYFQNLILNKRKNKSILQRPKNSSIIRFLSNNYKADEEETTLLESEVSIIFIYFFSIHYLFLFFFLIF